MLLLLLVLSLYGLQIEHNYDDAHKKALQNDKTLVVFLTKHTCPYCNKELAKLLNDKQIRTLLEKNTVFVIVTYEQPTSYPIEMLYTDRYPSLFFLDTYELFTCKALRGDINLKKFENVWSSVAALAAERKSVTSQVPLFCLCRYLFLPEWFYR